MTDYKNFQDLEKGLSELKDFQTLSRIVEPWQKLAFSVLLITHRIGFLEFHGWCPRSGVLWTQILKTLLVRTQSSKVLPSKPGEDPYIAMHATPAATDFFLANLYPSGPFTCIVSKTSRVFPVLAVANIGSCVGPKTKIGHPAHRYRQLMQVPMLTARGISIGNYKPCVAVFFFFFFFRVCVQKLWI